MFVTLPALFESGIHMDIRLAFRLAFRVVVGSPTYDRSSKAQLSLLYSSIRLTTPEYSQRYGVAQRVVVENIR